MLRIELLPSRSHLLIVIVLHLIAVTALLWVNLPTYFKMILAVLIFAASAHHILVVKKKWSWCIKALLISDQSVWVIRVNDRLMECDIVQYYCTPWLKVINLVLKAEREGGPASKRTSWLSRCRFRCSKNITVVILPDSASFAQRRRLARALKFRKFTTDEVLL